MRTSVTLTFVAIQFALAAITHAGEPLTPTFNRDIAPLLHKHCAGCHRPGEIGPFTLLSYQDARKRVRQLVDVVQTGLMPPWPPHSQWGEFRDSRALSPSQIRLIERWAETGAKEGEAADLPPPPSFSDGWQLGQPDLVLEMENPFPIPAEGNDVYSHFVFPLNLTKERYLSGIEVIPGNKRAAHHAVGILDASGTARRKAKEHDGFGYPGNAPGFLPSGFTPGFVPGQTPRKFKEGEAITLRPGTDLVLQMHYHPTGKPETDRTKIGLHFTDQKPKRNLSVFLLGSVDIDIPPDESKYKRTDAFRLPVDYEVRSIWAHMHLIGRDAKVWAEMPDGSEKKLLWIDDWNFNWQDTYDYEQPFTLPKGTLVRAEFLWDNSAENPRNPFSPPQRIVNGEQSTDEMGGIIIGGVPVRPEEEWLHWAGVLFHYLAVESRAKRQ